MGDIFAILNAIIQIFGVVGSQSYGLVWTLYPSMFLLGVLVVGQTISAGVMLGLFIAGKDLKRSTAGPTGISPGIGVLISLLYMLTAYQIYLIGYPVFAGIGFAHATLNLIIHAMKGVFSK